MLRMLFIYFCANILINLITFYAIPSGYFNFVGVNLEVVNIRVLLVYVRNIFFRGTPECNRVVHMQIRKHSKD